MKQLTWFIPLLIFVAVCIFLYKGLQRDHSITSAFINKSAPHFILPDLFNAEKLINEKALLDQLILINFWASWCSACMKEHSILLKISEEYQVQLIGVNYKDDTEKAKAWLQNLGNPYKMVLSDSTGKSAIDWGVIAVPETFLVDQNGIVRYKHTGPITLTVWEEEIWPLICTLSNNRFSRCPK